MMTGKNPGDLLPDTKAARAQRFEQETHSAKAAFPQTLVGAIPLHAHRQLILMDQPALILQICQHLLQYLVAVLVIVCGVTPRLSRCAPSHEPAQILMVSSLVSKPP